MNITGSRTTTDISSRVQAADVGLLLLRLVFGGLLAAAGLQKLFGWFGGQGLTSTGAIFEQIGYSPGVFFAAVAGLLETVGGLLLLMGLFTPLACSIVLGVMINAMSATWAGGLFGQQGYQAALLYATAGAVIACTGAGAMALDHGRPWQREGAPWAVASIVTGIAAAVAVLLLKAVV
jgi:putative oxidoreductase